jgi:Zn-dependent peptidase ImmA (M78 family)
MTSSQQNPSWLRAIKDAANQQNIPLPPFTDAGMGSALCRGTSGERFISFKRRLVSVTDAVNAGVEWTLWLEENDQPTPIATFREPLTPDPDRVIATLSILRGWLVDQWTVKTAERTAAIHANARLVRIAPPKSDIQEYWLSSDHCFGIRVEKDHWAIYSRGKSLSVWRTKKDEHMGDRLPLSRLDHLCIWLAQQWYVIAYGKDVRPPLLRELSVAASRAYDDAQLMRRTEGEDTIVAWWLRHAIRAADDELPNIFFERQADELVVSWDAAPTSTRFYSISYGEEVLPVSFAVPVLRKLVRNRLQSVTIEEKERSRLLMATSGDAAAGYVALKQYKPAISTAWLTRVGFSEGDARRFAVAGTSSHPIVGLLRSSQDSPVFTDDYEQVLRLLKPSDSESYERLRKVAKGISSAVDVRAPWESGYRLASLVREKLGRSPDDQFDIEAEAREVGIDVHDVPLTDTTILGACVGSSAFAPLIVLNPSCPDASGVSGRRITLAHELCHLLFDRSRMQSLARFEGSTANTDRLIEMRANAFAVELLVPMSTLIDDGHVVEGEEELKRISTERKVSLHALSRHVANLRNRLSKRD